MSILEQLVDERVKHFEQLMVEHEKVQSAEQKVKEAANLKFERCKIELEEKTKKLADLQILLIQSNRNTVRLDGELKKAREEAKEDDEKHFDELDKYREEARQIEKKLNNELEKVRGEGRQEKEKQDDELKNASSKIAILTRKLADKDRRIEMMAYEMETMRKSLASLDEFRKKMKKAHETESDQINEEVAIVARVGIVRTIDMDNPIDGEEGERDVAESLEQQLDESEEKEEEEEERNEENEEEVVEITPSRRKFPAVKNGSWKPIKELFRTHWYKASGNLVQVTRTTLDLIEEKARNDVEWSNIKTIWLENGMPIEVIVFKALSSLRVNKMMSQSRLDRLFSLLLLFLFFFSLSLSLLPLFFFFSSGPVSYVSSLFICVFLELSCFNVLKKYFYFSHVVSTILKKTCGNTERRAPTR